MGSNPEMPDIVTLICSFLILVLKFNIYDICVTIELNMKSLRPCTICTHNKGKAFLRSYHSLHLKCSPQSYVFIAWSLTGGTIWGGSEKFGNWSIDRSRFLGIGESWEPHFYFLGCFLCHLLLPVWVMWTLCQHTPEARCSAQVPRVRQSCTAPSKTRSQNEFILPHLCQII